MYAYHDATIFWQAFSDQILVSWQALPEVNIDWKSLVLASVPNLVFWQAFSDQILVSWQALPELNIEDHISRKSWVLP